jgi:hypothetical protein
VRQDWSGESSLGTLRAIRHRGRKVAAVLSLSTVPRSLASDCYCGHALWNIGPTIGSRRRICRRFASSNPRLSRGVGAHDEPRSHSPAPTLSVASVCLHGPFGNLVHQHSRTISFSVSKRRVGHGSSSRNVRRGGCRPAHGNVPSLRLQPPLAVSSEAQEASGSGVPILSSVLGRRSQQGGGVSPNRSIKPTATPPLRSGAAAA